MRDPDRPETTALGGAAAAIGLGDRNHVCLVGGGGKTTLLFALGRQVQGTVVLTTTTKMGTGRTDGLTPLYDPTDARLGEVLATGGRALAWREDGGHKALGVPPARCDEWFASVADHVIVEGDGSRNLPFKAPASYEPVIPATASVVVVCAGAAALGAPIEAACHRPDRVAALAGCAPTELLTPDRAAAVLVHPDGGRRHVPDGARLVVAVNRVPPRAPAVTELHAHLTAEGVDVVLVADDPSHVT